MPRVLYVADSLMAGGIESQLVELVTRLDRGRDQPHVLCLYGPRTRDLHFAPRLQDVGVPLDVLDLRLSVGDKARAIGHIIARVWALRPRIVQPEGYHANLLTRLARPLLPPTLLLGTVRGMLSPKQLLYERLSYRLCQSIVVNAPQLKRMLVEDAALPAAKVEHIPNGIDIARFARPYDPYLREQIAPSDCRLLVCMGRIGSEKQMHRTVAALGLLKSQRRLPSGVRLAIVGPVESRAAQILLDEAVAEYALGDVVAQYPATAHPEDFFHACDASVLFSPAEGLSNVSVESLAASRPVIIGAAANAAAVIEDGVTGWIARSNELSTLADTLDAMFTTPRTTMERMRAACLARARDFTVEAMVRRYQRLYASLMDGASHI